MQKKAHDISVAIVTRNRYNDLRILLAALNKQAIQPECIMVIDNSSTDATKNITDAYSGVIPLKYYLCTEIGVYYARNMALQFCETRRLAFIDDDAIPNVQWIAELNAMIALYPGAAAIVGVKENYYKNELVPSAMQFTSRDISMNRDRNGEFVLSPTIMDTCNLLLNTAALRLKNISFAKGIARGEDRYLGHRIMHENLSIYFAEKAIVYHKWPKKLGEYIRLRWLGGQAPLFIEKNIGAFAYRKDTSQRMSWISFAALLRKRISPEWKTLEKAAFLILIFCGIGISKCGYFCAKMKRK